MTTQKYNILPVYQKLLTFTKDVRVWVYTLSALACAACGVDDEPRYNSDKKSYGVTGTNSQHNEGAVSVSTTPRAPVALDGEEPEDFLLDPDDVIFRAEYRGQLLRSTLRLIEDEDSQIEPKQSPYYDEYAERIEGFFEHDVTLVAEQTAGDSKHALFRQMVKTPFNLSKSGSGGKTMFKDSNESGTQIYDRAMDDGCPESLVCVERAQSIPNHGVAQTFCYYNEQGETVSIPTGVSPGTTFASVKSLKKIHGPFTVKRFAVADVDCRQTELDPQTSQKIRILVNPDRSAKTLREINKMVKSGEKIDFGVNVFVEKLSDEGQVQSVNLHPYVDEVAGFQAKTSYYFNDENGKLLKIVKTFRKELGGMIALKYGGVVLDVAFSFCKSLLSDSNESLCSDSDVQEP